MKKFIFCLGSIFLCACIATAQDTKAPQKPKISNGIKITASKEIQIKEAYLYDDNGDPISDSNLVALNENANLMVEIERGGWVERNGMVSVGAQERIVTSEGEEILNEPDLFAKFTDIKAEDAQYVTIKAVITSQQRKFDFFLVSFIIWDKWGKGKITGSFKIKIR